MKQKLENLLQQAIANLQHESIIGRDLTPQTTVERSRQTQHGDYASNIALVLAKLTQANPMALAQKIVDQLPADAMVAKVEIANPGFINFFIKADAQFQIVKRILTEGDKFGLSKIGNGQKVQVEFVSANPTGPLHVGHGRGAAYGSAIAGLLHAVGFKVTSEYYVNDAGRQMDILATSVWLRYLEASGEVLAFPSNGYRGEYIRTIASTIRKTVGNGYWRTAEQVWQDIPNEDAHPEGKEKRIDALIERAKTLLGQSYHKVLQEALDSILSGIKQDLKEFGVIYQEWFSERQLVDGGLIQKAIERLDAAGFVYVKAGATWFASSRLGDDKDRVLLRENGQSTYFASDIAYHINKLERGFDRIINIWGADHHGYIPRIRAAMKALGLDDSKLSVKLVQFAVLYRGKKKLPMSTRSGEFVALRQLCDDIGADAARFFYVMRKAEQHLDFDLKLATSKKNENPVFYVQYAHARVCSVLIEVEEKNWERDKALGMAQLNLLLEEHETELLTSLSKYAETLELAALQYEPHLLINYLRELANHFHTYYNAHKFLVADAALRNARLNLIDATRQILANGLSLLNINPRESM